MTVSLQTRLTLERELRSRAEPGVPRDPEFDTAGFASITYVDTALALKRDTALANGYLWIGNGSGQSAAVLMSGDATISNAGVLTLATAQSAAHTWAGTQTFTVAPVFTDGPGSRTALGLGTAATQASSAFDAAGAAAAAQAASQPLDTQLTSLATLTYGSNALKVVRINAGETGFELATITPGTGDVVGPGSATADAVALFNGTTGKLIKDSTKAYTPTGIGLGSVTNDAQTKAAIVPNTAPTAGQLLVGNAGGTAYAPVAASGDAMVASTGAVTIANSAVTLAKIANAAASSKLLGSGASGSGAAYAELTLGTNLSMSGTTLNATGSSGGCTLIERVTLGSAATDINFTTFNSASYKRLQLVVSAAAVGGTGYNLFVYFGTGGGAVDATNANYQGQNLTSSSGGTSASSPAFPYIGAMAASSDLDYIGDIFFSPNGKATCMGRSRENSGGSIAQRFFSFTWTTAGALTGMQIHADSATQIAAGSYAELWGYT